MSNASVHLNAVCVDGRVDDTFLLPAFKVLNIGRAQLLGTLDLKSTIPACKSGHTIRLLSLAGPGCQESWPCSQLSF